MPKHLTEAERVIKELKPYLYGGIGINVDVKDNGQLVTVDISLNVSHWFSSKDQTCRDRLNELFDALDRVRKKYLIDVDWSYQQGIKEQEKDK